MSNKKVLVWMNCYGGWAPKLRQPIETIGYNQYLNDFVEAMSIIADQIEAIYISGGMYNSLNRTECETVKPELEKRLQKVGINIKVQTDEKSLTSASIMHEFLNTWKEKYSDCIPILFVDAVRYKTNTFTCEYYCKELKIDLNPIDVLVPLMRLDNNQNSTQEAQDKKLQAMKEKGVEYVEKLELEIRKEHIDKKNVQR
jgi:hypothetical protein